MGIPALDAHGLLPIGTHNCTLEEMELSFCWNSHRSALVSHLKDFLDQQWRPLGIDVPLWIDGSFTRKKDEPEDIDLVVDVSHLSDTKFIPVLKIYLRQAEIKKNYKVDFWPKHPMFSSDLTVYFRYVGLKASGELGIDSKQIKGILRVHI